MCIQCTNATWLTPMARPCVGRGASDEQIRARDGLGSRFQTSDRVTVVALVDLMNEMPGMDHQMSGSGPAGSPARARSSLARGLRHSSRPDRRHPSGLTDRRPDA
jgi:hypothetical protein